MGRSGTDSLLKQRQKKGRVCVLSSGSLYDVTEFADRHPGGRAWLEKYAGQDVTGVMRDSTPHRHSKAAYSILEKYRVVEDVAEGRDPQQNGPDSMKGNSGFHDMKADTLIDWDKPVLGQITGLGENYYQWVHEPVDTSLRLFHSDLLEFFSKSPWYMVPIFWVPVTCMLLVRSYTLLSNAAAPVVWNFFMIEWTVTAMWMPLLVFLGLLLWTFCEYTLHRWLFHMKPPPNVPILVLLHFILHGQHHKSPMDRGRLVFPIIPASILAACIQGTYYLFSPWPVALALFAGTVMGYMCYDLTHYYIHHGTPSLEYFRSLKRYHVKHHFEEQQLGFGISSKFWDYPFGTLIPDSD